MGIPPKSFVFGYGHVYRVGGEWCGKQCIRYHNFRVLENLDLPDATASGYGGNIVLGAEKHSLPIEKNLDLQMGDSDEQPRIVHDSGGLSESARSDLELCMLTLEAGNSPENK